MVKACICPIALQPMPFKWLVRNFVFAGLRMIASCVGFTVGAFAFRVGWNQSRGCLWAAEIPLRIQKYRTRR